MKLGLRDAVILSVAFLLPTILMFERFVEPTRTAQAILVCLLVGIPLLLGVIAEIRAGRSYGREVDAHETREEGPNVQ